MKSFKQFLREMGELQRLQDRTASWFSGYKKKKQQAQDSLTGDRDLSPEEEIVLMLYTGSLHHRINKELLGKWLTGDVEQDKVDKVNKLLPRIIEKFKSSRNMYVFSGMRSPEDLERSEDGRIHLKNPAFTSTSLSARSATAFSDFGKKFSNAGQSEHMYSQTVRDKHYDTKLGKIVPKSIRAIPVRQRHEPSRLYGSSYRHLAKIHIPKDSHGMFVADYSSNSSEDEYLLNKGSHISFRGMPTIDHENRMVIWNGRLEHDGIAPTRHATEISPAQSDLFIDKPVKKRKQDWKESKPRIFKNLAKRIGDERYKDLPPLLQLIQKLRSQEAAFNVLATDDFFNSPEWNSHFKEPPPQTKTKTKIKKRIRVKGYKKEDGTTVHPYSYYKYVWSK